MNLLAVIVSPRRSLDKLASLRKCFSKHEDGLKTVTVLELTWDGLWNGLGQSLGIK